MPAWMAGIQVRRMRPETSMSAWIPALHAGMTESRSRTLRQALHPRVFKGAHGRARRKKIFFSDSMPSRLSVLRVLRALRGE